MASRYVAVIALVALVLCPVVAQAWINMGNPDVKIRDLTSGGTPPVTLKITGLKDMTYAFDGSDLEIPFKLEGSGATVWLIIYTVDAHPPLTISGEGPPPYRDPEHAAPGWHVYDDVDTLVYKSEGQRFPEGENVIVWNGRDMNGNIVPPGNYDLFLAAFDDEAIPHVVTSDGGGGHPGTCASWYVDLNREIMWKIGEGKVFKMRNDWIENPDAYDVVDTTALSDAVAGRYRLQRGGVYSASPMNLPDATEWIGHLYGNGGAIVRFTFDWDALRIIPHEDWAVDQGAEGGILAANLPGRQCADVYNPEEDIIYASGGVSGTVGVIKGWNATTGELVKEWDFSDLMMYDNKGTDRVQGPENLSKFPTGEYDPYGMATCSHHGSVIARIDYNGKIRWINRNGDYFGDQREYSEETGVGDYVYGHTEAPSFKYTVYSTKWGWTTYPQNGLDAINAGMVLGEDGSGLFFFQPKNFPLTWPDHCFIIDEDGPWDGVYLNIGAIGAEARKANDFKGDPMVVMPYDQKRVRLSPAAPAVEEAEISLPTRFAVKDPYPNPFSELGTTVRFRLPWSAHIAVKIYDERGRFVRDLVNDELGPGEFTFTWDGTDARGAKVASGTYIFRIEAPGLRMHKKVTFLR